MRLDECKIGTVVIVKHGKGNSYGEIGHIVGFTYNTDISASQYINPKIYVQMLRYATIPLVRFPASEEAVHHANLEIYNDDKIYGEINGILCAAT